MPPLKALAVFEAAARYQSFTLAAEVLSVTQAAVSHQIKALEDRLGVMLFHRIGRGQGLVLTEVGRAYFPRVANALDALRDATAELTQIESGNTITVSTLDSFANLWLLPRIGHFLKRYPDIRLSIIAGELEGGALARGAVDIDIRYGEGNWHEYQVQRILTESVFPVCSPALANGDPPLRVPQDLARHTLLHDVMAVDWSAWLDAAGVTDVDVSQGLTFNHSHMITQAAINGDGVALGRSALVVDAIRNGKLIKPFGPSLSTSYAYYLVCNKQAPAYVGVTAFIDWISEEAARSQAECL